MIHHVALPTDAGQRYYDTHYRFMLCAAVAAELNFELQPAREVGNTFNVEINHQPAIIDFSDHQALRPRRERVPYFKMHYSEKAHAGKPRLFPLGPVSYYDWEQFAKLRREIHYEARGETIVNCQAPGGAALERRARVQAFLEDAYGSRVDTAITDQPTFWRKAGSCRVAVFVPGARIDILDRGQWQYMAFGACTISPRLDITLPFMKPLLPGVHYLECRPDFSDLGDVVELALAHPTSCREIGTNAAQLFAETALPWKLWTWISECLEAS